MSDLTARDVVADLCSIPNPEGIDRTVTVNLGGVEQFVSIRGRDARNPVLVVCHGGPALPALPSAWTWQRGVEDFFTVVNYDQRSSGRSAVGLDPELDLSVERYVTDLIELTEWLRRELEVDKVGILGHSWGSIIGLLAARSRPDLLWAYIGVGQVVSGLENEAEAFAHAWRSASSDKNEEALEELRRLGDYPGSVPLTVDRIAICRRWAQHYGGLSAHRTRSSYFFGAMELSPYYSEKDMELIWFGQRNTSPKVVPQLLGINLAEELDFELPILQFFGRHDWTTPTGPVDRWFAEVRAPSKDAVWFEHSAHLCMVEEPGKFVVSLASLALPHANGADRNGETRISEERR